MAQSDSMLGDLADVERFTEPLDVAGATAGDAGDYLHMMVLIRKIEEAVADLVVAGKIKTPCHLGIGQEAIATGVAAKLAAGDRVFSAHRAHAHYLAGGGDCYRLIAEIMGKKDGCAGGMGGSTHIVDRDNGFYGSVPIVAATIPLAVGAPLAAKLDGGKDVAVSYFGDGASEEGVLHESLNLAASQQLPVLFVCENNLYSSHLDIQQRQPADSIARFGRAHQVASETVDGNDVLAVRDAAGRLIKTAREQRKPGFLEAVTYRWRGHVGPNEDIDVGVRRSASELDAWKRRDPIARLKEGMIARGFISEAQFTELQADVGEQVKSLCDKAEAAAYPDGAALLDLVYAGSSDGR
jgi:pyruvate dehydrogenase E1 component alpha subunit